MRNLVNTIKICVTMGLIFWINPCFSQLNTPIQPRSKVSTENLYFERTNVFSKNNKLSFTPVEIDNNNRDKRRSSCQYTSNAQLATLSTTQLIEYLKSTSDYDCQARILFNYEISNSPLIFTNEKIQAVANEICSIASAYNGTHANGIYGLICYLHVAIYFDFYYSSTISVNATSLTAIQNATDAVCSNTHMFDLNAEASAILDEFLIILDLTGIRSRPTTINFVKQVMKNMTINDTWKTAQDIKWVTCYWRIFFLMFRGSNDNSYINAIANDNEYLALWGSIATDSEIMNNTDINYIWQDNAILELGRVATNPLLTNKVCQYLANVCGLFPRLHKNWLNAVIPINDAGKCSQYNLCEDKNALKQEVMNFLFPNTFNYNDGTLVFKAKFAREVADNLYYATSQTQSQLFRLAQTDQPIVGDINTKLTCLVFESKEIYDNYAPFLYGISTNNGGMYLEQPAEFYTWDRPSTYYLSLEELFRHEYNHYLQGRFLIPGIWGNVPFYDNNRLTWYEEGHAELLCGSTDYEGIKLRENTINRLKSDYPNWPSLAEVFSSYYGQSGAIYYPYGNLLWFNWYINDYGKIKAFNDLTRNNDIVGFDNLVNSIKSSSTAESQWRSFLMDVYNGVIPSWQPKTLWSNDQNLTVATSADIQNEFTAITGITNITVISDATSIIRRFKIQGTITGIGTASNNTEAAIKINSALNTLMVQLKNDQYINNFDYTVGYFTNVTTPNNIPTANFCILGSLRDPSIPESPLADFSSNSVVTIAGNKVSYKSLSKGYIKGYLWSFQGGVPATSTDANPIVTYDTPGSYNVTLTTIGKTASEMNTKSLSNYIKVYAASNISYCTATHGYDYSWISRVKLKDIENITNSFPLNGYSDFKSNFITELLIGSTYPISIDLSYTNSPNIGISVWIDLNQDGTFSDIGEQLLFAKPSVLTQLSGASITIPSKIKIGVTCMRIRATYNGQTISPCGADAYMGEVEDYSIAITDNQSPTLPTNLTSSSLTHSSVTLNWIASSDNGLIAGYDIYVNGILNSSSIDTSYNVSGLVANTNYSITIEARDQAGNLSEASLPLNVTTLPSPVLTVSANTLTIAAPASSTKTFDITSNISWAAASNKTWLTVSNASGTENAAITLTAQENPTTATRTATVTVSGTGVSTQTITVTQDAGPPVLTVSANTLTIAAPASSTKTFDITSNISWAVASNQTWLTVSNASGTGNATIALTAQANPTTATRTATVTVSGTGVITQTITVAQDGGTTGIENIFNLNSITIFPNPNFGIFNLQFDNEFNGEITIRIYSGIGIYIKVIKLNKSINKMTQEINLENITKGIYFVELQTTKFRVVKMIVII